MNDRLKVAAGLLLGCLALFVLVAAGEVSGNIVSGSIKDTHVNASAAIQATKLATRTLASFPVKLTDFREWDAMAVNSPATGATTYLALVNGTYGTNPTQLQTGDLHAAGATTRRARCFMSLPDNYVASGNLVIRTVGGMSGHVADTSATVLVEAYQLNDDGTLGSQIVTTGATTLNSLTLANQDFTVTATGLVAGSRLDARVSVTVTDAAGVANVIGVVHSVVLRCDVQP